MTRRLSTLAAVACAVALLGSPEGPTRATAGTPGAVSSPADADPHRHPDRCSACHEGAPGAGPAPTTATCRGCHPTADMHPVGIAPEATRVPAGWPLEAGAVSCATCHAEPGCDPARSPERPWLRGGPVKRVATFCVRCHDSDGLKRTDPHHPETPRDPADPSCAACHVAPPEAGAAPSAARLRTPPIEACAECHGASPHAGAAQHVGARPETAGGLPLDAEGRIRCWTCHDVHAHAAGPAIRKPGPGVRAARATLRGLLGAVDAASRPDHPALLRLPAGDPLCRACHGDGG